jgi:hypothetical protein
VISDRLEIVIAAGFRAERHRRQTQNEFVAVGLMGPDVQMACPFGVIRFQC